MSAIGARRRDDRQRQGHRHRLRHRLRRYVALLGIFWRSALSAELEYRTNFIARVAISLFWTAWAALGVRVFFQFSTTIAGWDYGSLLVVVGLFFTINGVRQALFDPNLDRMTEYVRNGTLDFLLTKPVNTQFMVSFRHVGVYNLADPLLGLGLSTTGLVLVGHTPSPWNVVEFAAMLVVAIVLLYALTLVLMAVAVRVVNSEGLSDLSFVAVELSRFPVQLYRNPVQTILTVIPVAFLTTYPAQALLGTLDPIALAIGPIVACALVALASLAFRRALRTYSGASG